MKQGYQLIAVGHEKYLSMAVSAAASIRYWDPKRQVQLVTDLDVSHVGECFDVVTAYRRDPVYDGPLSKLRMLEYAVFEETMFVDADCLLLRPDIDEIWSELSDGFDVAVPGVWRERGEWYGMQIEDMCRIANVSRILQMNSGIFYFKQSDRAKAFFAKVNEYVETLGNFTQHIHGGTGAPDEPTLAVAFGAMALPPFRMYGSDGRAWMISTIGASEFQLSPTDGNPRFLKGSTVSPAFVHFVGLHPRGLYESLCAFYRKAEGLGQIL